MKIALIILGVLVTIFIIFQLYLMSGQRGIEIYPYKVVKAFDKFEIRNYEASLFTSVKLSEGEYRSASSKGFSILAGYIFGGNEKNEKIAMTSPVAMSMEDSMEMMFLVPKQYNKEKLPAPNSNQIEFKEMPAKTVAAISFGGWANDEKIAKYKQELIGLLNKNGISHTSKFYFLGYNSPAELINRKNEVIVELAPDSGS